MSTTTRAIRLVLGAAQHYADTSNAYMSGAIRDATHDLQPLLAEDDPLEELQRWRAILSDYGEDLDPAKARALFSHMLNNAMAHEKERDAARAELAKHETCIADNEKAFDEALAGLLSRAETAEAERDIARKDRDILTAEVARLEAQEFLGWPIKSSTPTPAAEPPAAARGKEDPRRGYSSKAEAILDVAADRDECGLPPLTEAEWPDWIKNWPDGEGVLSEEVLSKGSSPADRGTVDGGSVARTDPDRPESTEETDAAKSRDASDSEGGPESRSVSANLSHKEPRAAGNRAVGDDGLTDATPTGTAAATAKEPSPSGDVTAGSAAGAENEGARAAGATPRQNLCIVEKCGRLGIRVPGSYGYFCAEFHAGVDASIRRDFWREHRKRIKAEEKTAPAAPVAETSQ